MVEITKLSNKTWKEAQSFYSSKEWKDCRKLFLEGKTNRECIYCQHDFLGNNPKKLNLDHIKPLRYYWDLRTDHSNLQIVCEECNKNKGSRRNPEEGQSTYFDLNYRSAPKKNWNNPKYYSWLNKRKV